jgi:hypothetical protein
MSGDYLVQILLPKTNVKGEAVSQEWFEAFLKKLTLGSAARRVSSEPPARAFSETAAIRSATQSLS